MARKAAVFANRAIFGRNISELRSLNPMAFPPGSDNLKDDVQVALLTSLFASELSLMVGALVGFCMAGIVVGHCPNFWLTLCMSAIFVTGFGRVMSFYIFRKAFRKMYTAAWERVFECGAFCYALCLGMMSLLTLLISPDPKMHFVAVLVSTTYAGCSAMRNTGKPVLALSQLFASALPTSIGLCWHTESFTYLFLGVANFLYISVVADITLVTYKAVLEAFVDRQENKRLATIYENISKTDPLTGVANRTGLKLDLEAMLADSRMVAAMWLDLDRFKQINDTLGHGAGDQILNTVADRITGAVAPHGKLARFGGDEFIVILPVNNDMVALTMAELLCDKLAKPVSIDDVPVDISASVGVSLSTPGTSADDLLRHADVALYEAKASGRNCVKMFDPEMERRLLESKQIEDDLKRALTNGEFEVYYQPVVDLKSWRVRSFEALLRWHHPDRGSIPPSMFIPIAEANGLIDPITQWVLSEACRQAALWPRDITIAVNISPALLTNPALPNMIYEALLGSGLSPRRLNLEITETALVEDNPNTRVVLDRFKSMGMALSLDDFGTGYSSLSYLCRYRFDSLKIDRSFMTDIETHSESRAVIQAISGLASTLNLTVVAEGIEEISQLDYVCDQGCTKGQGYLFARPMPGPESAGYLTLAEGHLQIIRGRLEQFRAGPSAQPDVRVA